MAAASPSLQNLFDKPLKVLLSDGRTIIGKFVCIDRERNLVLVDAIAYLPSDSQLLDGSNPETDFRTLGVVMVPGKHLIKAEAEVSTS